MRKEVKQKQFELEFADQFRQLRADRDQTQVEFGKLLGIEPEEVSVYENAKRLPSLYRLAKFAEALDISIEALVPRL